MVHSLTEIVARKKKLGRALTSALYYLPAAGRIIFAPMYVSQSGIYFEQETASALPAPFDLELLGRNACASLVAFDRMSQDLRSRTKDDWAAYRISGEKSVRAFESSAIRITLETINASLRTEGWPKHGGHLFVGTFNVPSATHQEIGESILNIAAACEKLRAE